MRHRTLAPRLDTRPSCCLVPACVAAVTTKGERNQLKCRFSMLYLSTLDLQSMHWAKGAIVIVSDQTWLDLP
jgi:hypothetical protein